MGLVAVAFLVALVLLASDASAGQLRVSLGAADSFAVLGGQTVTNTGFSTLNGDLGVSPGTSLTGFPPGKVNGKVHATDPVANQAQSDLTTAYNDAAGRTPPNALPADVGGRTLAPGVYKSGAALELTGTLTLDARGDPNAVFIFQVGSKLTTAVSSRVNLIGGAQPGNVFWQIGSSATLGTSSVFAGTILAYTSISMNDGVTLNGRALARNGAVTLINDTITAPRDVRSFKSLISYAALGDSYSSGEGLPPYLSVAPGGGAAKECHRSKKAYPERFESGNYQGHPVMLDLFAACSGAKAENIYPVRQGGKTQHKGEHFPQAGGHIALNTGTDLVSITIGGNDVGFSTVVSVCYLDPNCQNAQVLKQMVARDFAALPSKLFRAFKAIEKAAPNATIVVLGYPYLFPTEFDRHGFVTPGTKKEQSCAESRFGRFAFDPKEQNYLNGNAYRLNRALSSAVAKIGRRKTRFSDPSSYFAGHAHCDMNGLPQWTNGRTGSVPPGKGSFHPNTAGQKAYGNYLYGYLCNVVKFDTRGVPCPPASAP